MPYEVLLEEPSVPLGRLHRDDGALGTHHMRRGERHEALVGAYVPEAVAGADQDLQRGKTYLGKGSRTVTTASGYDAPPHPLVDARGDSDGYTAEELLADDADGEWELHRRNIGSSSGCSLRVPRRDEAERR